MKSNEEGFKVVGIGTSAGGVKALETFFSTLPEKTGMAFVVIMHLSPDHNSQMAELLQRKTSMPLAEVTDPVRPEPDHVYIISPKKNITIENGMLQLIDRSKRTGEQAPVDLFFRALAQEYGDRAIAVIMTGSGSDGASGLSHVKERGGLTVVQSPEEAEYEAMPRSAISTGHVELILPLRQIFSEIVSLQKRETAMEFSGTVKGLEDGEEKSFSAILERVRLHSGQNFAPYKKTAILRRVRRRARLCGIDGLSDYLVHIRENPDEVSKLHNDFLLTVTSFFRDPKAFKLLKNKVVPQILRSGEDTVRIWSAGCATGEEAYSLAMLFEDQNERLDRPKKLQIFASDISEVALQTARKGLYPKGITNDLSTVYLNRFFDRKSDGYRVNENTREKIVFSLHNLLRDPPFVKLDLVACRNLLIYLDADSQKKIFDLFHYALNDGGYLFLGSSETTGNKLFQEIDENAHIFKKITGARQHVFPSLAYGKSRIQRELKPDDQPPTTVTPVEEIHRKFILPRSPAGVIVNSDYEVLHTLGGGDKYLSFVPGKPSQNLLKAVRNEFRVELRTALYDVFRERKKVTTRPVTYYLDSKPRTVQMILEPIEDPEFEENCAHVLFHETGSTILPLPEKPTSLPDATDAEDGHPARNSPTDMHDSVEIIHKLEQEIDALREQLHLRTHEYELAVGDLKAINEEQQSIHEELVSTSEELETSKEELQSMNEELLTLNQELQNKIAESASVNSDLENLISATKVPTIFLDKNLRVNRYTPSTPKLFNIMDSDIGRLMSDLTHHLDYDHLLSDAGKVYREAVELTREMQSVETKNWYMAIFRPYLNTTGQVMGVVITFIDITEKTVYKEKIESLNDSLKLQVAKRTRKIKDLALEIVHTEQAERDRISELLHDDLQQQLFSLKMSIDLMQKGLAAETMDTLATELVEWDKLVTDTIQTTRNLASSLSPPSYFENGLSSGLEWIVDLMESMHGLQVDLDMKSNIRLDNGHLSGVIVQMVRELLFNIVKHAGVDQAQLRLDERGGKLVIEVIDEGGGFDVKQGGKKMSDGEEVRQSYGLSQVKARVELFDGTVRIKSSPEKGTKITLSIPL